MPRLINDAHPAPAGLPRDPEIAQLLRNIRTYLVTGSSTLVVLGHLLDEHQGGHELPDLQSQLRMVAHQRFDVGCTTGTYSRTHFFCDQAIDKEFLTIGSQFNL